MDLIILETSLSAILGFLFFHALLSIVKNVWIKPGTLILYLLGMMYVILSSMSHGFIVFFFSSIIFSMMVFVYYFCLLPCFKNSTALKLVRILDTSQPKTLAALMDAHTIASS